MDQEAHVLKGTCQHGPFPYLREKRGYAIPAQTFDAAVNADNELVES